jgi:hypothetical protein
VRRSRVDLGDRGQGSGPGKQHSWSHGDGPFVRSEAEPQGRQVVRPCGELSEQRKGDK